MARVAGSNARCKQGVDEFSACESLDDWVAAGLHQLAGVETAAGGGPCHKCHDSGVGDVYLGNPFKEASIVDGFEMQRPPPQVFLLVMASVGEDGCLEDLVPSHGYETVPPGHPAWVLPAELVDGLQQFYEATHAKWLAGTCGP